MGHAISLIPPRSLGIPSFQTLSLVVPEGIPSFQALSFKAKIVACALLEIAVALLAYYYVPEV